jgi:hypothetical protein
MQLKNDKIMKVFLEGSCRNKGMSESIATCSLATEWELKRLFCISGDKKVDSVVMGYCIEQFDSILHNYYF